MPRFTPRLGLRVPLINETADISVINSNMDVIDEQIVLAGTNNQAVNTNRALDFRIDTRSTNLTYTAGRLTKVEEKDGTTVVKTTIINYDVNGRVASIRESAGGKTVTSTLTYAANGLSSVAREVF